MYEYHLKETICTGDRRQDSLNPLKYRYVQAFHDLVADNTHLVALVLFRFHEDETSTPRANNYIVTAYQKVMR